MKRAGRRLTIALAALVLLRIALPWLSELGAGALLRARGLELRALELDFALHSGDVRVQGLELGLRAFPEREPLLRLERASVDLRLSALLRGDLHLERVAVEGLELRLDLEPERVRELQRAFRPERAPATPPAQLSLDWRPPLRIDMLRVEHMRVHLVDAQAEPALDARLECNLLATAVGVPGERAHVELFLNGPRVLDVLHLEAEGRGEYALLDAQVALDVRGLRLDPLRGALARLGIEPGAQELDLRAQLALALQPLQAPQSEPGQQATQATDGLPQAASGRIELSACRALADQREVLALDELALEFASFAPSGVQLERGLLRGLRAALGRRADGALRVGGLELATAPSGEWSGAQLARLAHVALVDPLARAFSAPWTVRELELGAAELRFHDETVEPPAQLELQLESARYRDGEPRGALELLVRAPGLFESLRLAGEAQLLGEARALDLQLELLGIAPQAARPYLARLGWAPVEDAGALRARVQASAQRTPQGATLVEAELSALELRLGQESRACAALERLRAHELVIDADAQRVRVGGLELAGARAQLKRTPDGAWRALGLRTLRAEERVAAPEAGARVRARVPASPSAAPLGAATSEAAARLVAASSPAASSKSAPNPAAPAHGRLELDLVHVHGGALEILDEAHTPPIEVRLEHELRLESLVLDSDPQGAPASPAALALDFRSSGLVAELNARGTLSSQPGPLALQLELDTLASVQSAAPLAPWLAAYGLLPQLEQGRLAFRAQAALQARPEGLLLGLALRELEAKAGAELLARIEALDVRRALLGAHGLEVEALELRDAQLRLERDERGSWCAGGLVFLPREAQMAERDAPQAPRNAQAAAPATQPSTSRPVASQPSDSQPAVNPVPVAAVGAPRYALERLRIAGAEVQLRDRAVQPALELALRADLELDDWVHAPQAEPATWRAALSAAPLARQLSAEGTLLTTPTRVALHAQLQGEGLELLPLAAHLPSSWRAHAMDASAQGALELAFEPHAQGGFGLELGLRDCELHALAEPASVWALRELTLRAPRIDASASVYDIDALELEGAQLELSRTRERGWRALGLELGAPERSEAAAAQPAEAERAQDSAEPAPAAVATVGGARAPRATTPQLRLGSLLLDLERCALRDEARPDAPALQGALRVESSGPFELAAPRGTEWALHTRASAPPVLGGLALELRGSSWLRGPRLAFELEAHEIDAEALAPWLERESLSVRGSGMRQGELRGRGEARVLPGRNAGRAGWWRAPFGLEADLAQLELRRAPEGEVLAGIGSLRLEARLIDFARRRFELPLIELNDLAGQLTRRVGSWHAFGLAFEARAPLSAAADPEPAATEPELAEMTGAAPPAAESQAALIALPFEFEVGELVLSGLDFELRDESVDPPAQFPLRELHAEVRQLGTRALRGEQPVRFQASVGAARVQLPPRGEERPAFEELALRGSLRLAPEPRGWMRFSATGVELLGAASLARERGLTIGAGLLDAGVRVRVRGLDDIAVRSSFSFSELSLSEQAGGPIESVLQLPAPLDVALFALRDSEGEIDVPLSFELRSRRISGGQVARAAAGATTSVVANAIASSPLRLASGLTGLFGFGGSEEQEPVAPSALAFAPGASALESEARAEAARLVQRLSSDARLVLVLEHELAPADVERAQLLANPDREHCLALAAALRAERTRLSGERERVALQLGAARALVHDAQLADERAAKLRSLDAQSAELERALDGALELLRPGAARFRDRRTRSACLELGRARLEAVRAAVLAALPSADRRVELRSPKMRLPVAAAQPSSEASSQPNSQPSSAPSLPPSAEPGNESTLGRVLARLRQRSN